jgi:cold shock CspA family protein
MSTVPTAAARRWRGRPVQAALIRAVAFIAPIAASVGFVDLASRVAPAPLSSLWAYLLWWLWLSTAATLVLMGVDWLARRLLPLAALLKLSLIFPDQTPSRFKTAMRAGSIKNLESRMEELRQAGVSPAQSAALLLELIAALNSHDRVTRGHSERVRAYSVLIGEELGLTPEDLDLLNWSALLHDVGKLSVPSAILNKPDKPDEDEWQVLRSHPLFGEKLVEPLRNWLGQWADAVGYHHERWDGRGYPRGVEGKSIPLPGRIVAVADVYDVITSARSYKKAGDARDGREEISRCAGSQFDPTVVRAFLGVSIGRMRLIMGPVSWLSHAPVLSQIPFASVGSAVSGALGVLAVAGSGGLISGAPAVAARAQAPLVAHVAARTHPAAHPHHHVLTRTHVPPAPSAPPPPPAPPSNPTVPSAPPPSTTLPITTSPSAPPPQPPSQSVSVTNAVRDSARVLEGGTVVIDVLANDTNSHDDALDVTLVEAPDKGSATVTHGAVSYSAPRDWAGTLSFEYRAASRVDNASDTAAVTVTVMPVNHAPSFVAGGDQTVLEDSNAHSVTAWATQVSPGPANESGQKVSFNVANDDHGLFTEQPSISPDGTLTYTPAPNANGVAHVTASLQDDGGIANGGVDESAPQTFTITVSPVNDAPSFAAGANQAVLEDSGSHSVTAWASQITPGPANESGQKVSFDVANDDHGLFSRQPAVSSGGTLTYAPAPDANGTAHVTVTAHDDGGTANGGVDASAAQSFTITVTPVNDAPSFVAGNDQTVLEDSGSQSITGWATQISAGPADEWAQIVDFQTTGNTNPALFSALPVVDPSTGSLAFTPAANASGTATISIVLHDDGGTANGGVDASAAQSFTITVSPVNDAPSFVAGNDQTVLEDSGSQSIPGWATAISAGPPDESGQTVTFNVQNDNQSLFSAQPAVSSGGTLTYTSAPDANGTAHVTVTAHDDGGTANGGVDTSAPQTFTITVTPVNDAPSFVVGSDPIALDDNGAQSIAGWATQISRGPVDESAQVLDFQTTGDTNPSLFSVTPTVDPATGTLSFTPAANAAGTATITLVLHDNGGTANGGVDTSGSQSFTITAVADPTPAPDSFQGWTGSDVVGNLLTNDTDPQGSPLTLHSAPASGPANGTLTLNSSDGTFDYVPNPGFTGTDSFTYTVENAYHATATAQVTITISAPAGVSTSLVAAVNSKDSTFPYHVVTASFTPVNGATYLVFAGRASSAGDSATLVTTGSLDLPSAPMDGAIGADGVTRGWVWVVHGILGGLSSTVTVTFANPNSKTVASDVLEVVQVGGSGIDHDTAGNGLVSSSAATVSLTSPGLNDSELAFLYVNGDIASDPGWKTSGIATLSGSLLHSPDGTSGFGALIGYAPQALASATTNSKFPAKNGNSYVYVAVDLLP